MANQMYLLVQTVRSGDTAMYVILLYFQLFLNEKTFCISTKSCPFKG